MVRSACHTFVPGLGVEYGVDVVHAGALVDPAADPVVAALLVELRLAFVGLSGAGEVLTRLREVVHGLRSGLIDQ